MISLRTLFFGSMFAIIAFAGWRTYNYYYDTSVPVVELTGIEENGYYNGDVNCILRGSDAYKVKDLSIFLDDNKELIRNHRVSSRTFEHPFTIPTTTLTQGKHAITYVVTDASRHANQEKKTISFFVDNASLQVALVSRADDLKVFQGRALHVQFQANKTIKKAICKALSLEYECFPESANSLVYECFIPVSVEEIPNEYVATIDIADHVGNTVTLEQKFQVIAFPFKSQTLRLEQEKIKQEAALGATEEMFEADMAQATAQSPKKKLWSGVFYVPCDSKAITTEFGTIRVSQHKGKSRHNAIDLAGSPRSVVWASQDGVVVIKKRYAHAGNTVVIDHGYGLLSAYFHLEEYADKLNVGDTIQKGRPVGKLGMTGHATGYHLHWEVRLGNKKVDPMQWTKNTL
ncbi:MAG: Peptidase M23B [candidate division TM6 bacterium GW2011_GWE2_41_16]|nr:MAG: Peptidase M23B [candidate division TM6 bacterium GW2011_GWE2_41_16]